MLTDGPTPQERDAIAAHFNYLSDLQSKGIVWFAGRTQINDDRTRGICIFTADSQTAADALIQADPCILQQVMTAEVLPFKVAIPSE